MNNSLSIHTFPDIFMGHINLNCENSYPSFWYCQILRYFDCFPISLKLINVGSFELQSQSLQTTMNNWRISSENGCTGWSRTMNNVPLTWMNHRVWPNCLRTHMNGWYVRILWLKWNKIGISLWIYVCVIFGVNLEQNWFRTVYQKTKISYSF